MVTEQELRALEARMDMLEGQMRQMKRNKTAESLVERHGYLLTKHEAGKLLGVCRQTIYAMIRDGRLEESVDGRVLTESMAKYVSGKESCRSKRGPKAKEAEEREQTRRRLNTMREAEEHNAKSIEAWEEAHAED